jgi:hypothetical protein
LKATALTAGANVVDSKHADTRHKHMLVLMLENSADCDEGKFFKTNEFQIE